MANYLSGFHGSVKIGTSPGTTLCINSWDATVETDLFDVSTSCSQGWHESITGLSQATGTLKAFYDGSAPPTLVTGTTTTLDLYVDSAQTHGLVMTAIIKSVAFAVSVDAVTTYTLSFVSTGVVTQI